MSHRKRSRRRHSHPEQRVTSVVRRQTDAQSVPVVIGKQMFNDLLTAINNDNSDAIESLLAFREEMRQYVHTQEDSRLREELKDKYECIIRFLATPHIGKNLVP